jgi:hypothetical protein
LAGDSIIIIGVTDSGEIRDIQSEHDPRLGHSEDFRSNPVKRDDFVHPIATFQLQFSNDNAITQLFFLQQTAIMKPSGPKLKLLGKLNLNSEGSNPTK